MSRSYHVTEKQAGVAFSQGDVEPAYAASEKSWVKKQQLSSRRKGAPATNRAVVSREKARTRRVKERVSAPQQPG